MARGKHSLFGQGRSHSPTTFSNQARCVPHPSLANNMTNIPQPFFTFPNYSLAWEASAQIVVGKLSFFFFLHENHPRNWTRQFFFVGYHWWPCILLHLRLNYIWFVILSLFVDPWAQHYSTLKYRAQHWISKITMYYVMVKPNTH